MLPKLADIARKEYNNAKAIEVEQYVPRIIERLN